MFDWFKKRKNIPPAPTPQQVNPEEGGDDGPPGEADTLVRIKHLCWMAGMSAESVANDKATRPLNEWDQYEYDRYASLWEEAASLTDTLTDDFYRSAALHFLIDTCMKAADARALFKHVEVDFIREKILESYPTARAKVCFRPY